jgi:cytosine/adenosine deaminase-related metal-dependent hydrolase
MMAANLRGGARPISFINADLGRIGASSLRVVRSTIDSVGENPVSGDLVVDLEKDRLLPGLINAHDHLQLNIFRRLKYRERHANVSEWIEDINCHRSSAPDFVRHLALPLHVRQLHGGLKNILSGVTTVAHHDPMHAALLADDFPTRVVTNFGWAHSLAIDGASRVQKSYRDTPAQWPWAIHAAEGVDQEAGEEISSLDALGCLGPNTLIVHGTGMGAVQQERVIAAGAGVIWCPSSNMHLFGRTLDVGALASRHRVALGTDSRMSGERDLLWELAVAKEECQLDDRALESMVSCDSARLLGLTDRGSLAPGALADLLILPAHSRLHQTKRSDIRLVMLNGRICIGDMHYIAQLAPALPWTEIELDGHRKFMDSALATQTVELDIDEPGLAVRRANWRAA